MGRIVRRVPLDFDHPTNELWPGYLLPDALRLPPCPDCDRSGYAPHARMLHGLWYGYIPFRPEDNGCVPFTSDHPEIVSLTRRNLAAAPSCYGIGRDAFDVEARRLTLLFNSKWRNHLNADDVAALIAAYRLWAFTHTVVSGKWEPIDPTPVVTPEQVNSWNIRSMGHDSINAAICIEARCLREGYPFKCATCHGHGVVESYPGQRDEADAWEPYDPPTGPGWQLWTTTTEGSPMTPVFLTADALASFCADTGVSTFGSQTADKEWWLSFISGKEIGVEISPGVIAI